AIEQQDRPAVRRELSHDEVEQRGLAGAVRTDDQPPLARLDDEIDVGGDAQAAERLAEPVDDERGHGVAPAPSAAPALRRPRSERHPIRHSRALPGTRPSGMKRTMSTKMAPSMKFQRSTYALTTFLTMTSSAAPTI